MPRNQGLSNFFRELARLLEEEANSNPDFAARLEAIVAPVRRPPRKSEPGAGCRSPSAALPDVLSALDQMGKEEFRFWLRSFDLSTLRAIVKANGFDVARLSQKWREPDKFIGLIAEQTSARLRRGSGFLPLKKGQSTVTSERLPKKTVYAFEVYDIRTDQYKRSARKATSDAIESIETARIVPGTKEDIDSFLLDGNGMYKPGT